MSASHQYAELLFNMTLGAADPRNHKMTAELKAIFKAAIDELDDKQACRLARKCKKTAQSES